jgi:hypothetical protein
MGQNIELNFQFGSDSSVQYPGWYLNSVVVGGTDPVSTDATDWNSMKASYR